MPVMPTLRFADPDTAGRYPLAVSTEPVWRCASAGWEVELALPDLRPGTLLVPSLALPSGAAAEMHHQWVLDAPVGRWPLQPVPARTPLSQAAQGSPVSTHIDCFRVHRAIAAPRLRVRVESPVQPEHHLIVVSSRVFTLGDVPAPERAAALPAAPPPRSQMTAPEALAPRICSPTCVSMVLDLWQRRHDWLEVVAECHDPASGTYGVWPLALAAAARRGCIGAIELFDDWTQPLTVLDCGIPLVTSIRFAEGELPGAPLPETHGHLVVVYAAGPAQVDVCDPAAGPGEVARRYPAEAFSRAWLRHRGAAYILPS